MAENRSSDKTSANSNERQRLLMGVALGVGLVLLLLICLGLGYLVGSGKLFGGNATSTPVSGLTPADTPTAATTVATEAVTATLEVGNGACNAACDPAKSNCLAGLSCVPVTATPGKYICWNASICKSATPKPAVCQPGWLPASGCTCCGTTLVCSDGKVAAFNPQCGVGGYP